MPILAAHGDPPPDDVLDAAAAALRSGHPVAIPTDTVYGLAVDPFVPGATNRVFEVKRRPRDVSLPVLVAHRDQVLELAASIGAVAERLMDRFWPGALTIVLPTRAGLDADLGDDGTTVGLRMPEHPVALALCRRVGPLATTSANRHGEPTLLTAAAVYEAFGEEVPVVVDGGPCEGAPSTVVDATGREPTLLRAGRIPWENVLSGA